MALKPRKYQNLWSVIKSSNFATISVENAASLSLKQRITVTKTIRQAVIKEKHLDGHFKKSNPKLILDIICIEDHHKMVFKLVEKDDPSTMFL